MHTQTSYRRRREPDATLEQRVTVHEPRATLARTVLLPAYIYGCGIIPPWLGKGAEQSKPTLELPVPEPRATFELLTDSDFLLPVGQKPLPTYLPLDLH